MLKKIYAAILGGLVFFVWAFVAHMLTGLGETGIQEIPNEQAVVTSMKASLPGSGMYMFPGWGLPTDASHADKMKAMQSDAMQAKMKSGPTGVLIYRAQGMGGVSLRPMIIEFGTEVVQIFLVILLLGQTRIVNFVGRWRFVTIAGFLAAISTNISYWNWFGFPGNYTTAYIAVIAVGFTLAGLVVAAIVKPVQEALAHSA